MVLSRGSRIRFGALIASMVVFATACAGADALTTPTHSGPTAEVSDCILGLDLWDTDPALTWIADGRVWVRTGDSQACLDHTDAATHWWSPDGLRLFLDDEIVDTGVASNAPETTDARQILWQQPLGHELVVVDADGAARSHVLATGEVRPVAVPSGTVLLASHPDGVHAATVEQSGRVALLSFESGDQAELFTLTPGEQPIQIDFSPDGSRLWVLTDAEGTSQARSVDLTPISASLEIEPPSPSIIPLPESLIPPPQLRYLNADLAPDALDVGVAPGARGAHATGFVLHPSHPEWIVLTEGQCSDAVSTLFVDGEPETAGIPGVAVGFFRGRGLSILATTTAGNGCGTGALWVTEGLPAVDSGSAVLIADDVRSADIRDEAPDPWNPNTAPPFA